MKTSRTVRTQIEEELSPRITSALSPTIRHERLVASTGISAVDDLLEGGLPVGAITEIIGTESSGRTTVAMSFVAQQTHANRVCAWVDASDMLDPESAAASGVLLDHLLWVRCGRMPATSSVEDTSCPANSDPVAAKKYIGKGSVQRPQKEHDLASAIDMLLQGQEPSYRRNKYIGTPGASNCSLMTSPPSHTQYKRVEQIPFDRLPARRGSNLLRKNQELCAIRQNDSLSNIPNPKIASIQHAQRNLVTPWRYPNSPKRNELQSRGPLDQALRSTDLLLQGGGFSAIVLDMGQITAEAVSRIPLATWFKFRAAADRNHTSLLLLTQHFCSKSSAAVVLRVDALPPSGNSILTCISFRLSIAKQCYKPQNEALAMRKPPIRAAQAVWESPMSWARGW